MREIKFRAWIYGLGKMTSVKEIDFDGYMPSVMVEINSERHEQMFFENADYPDCELMQYTGLKDKNGVEIYEGDILEGYSVYPTKDTFQSKILGDVYCSNRGTWDCYSFLLGDINEQMEVVGNIYDNPELMEVEECGI